MSDEKPKKFDFSDVLQSPAIKELLQREAIESVTKSVQMLAMLKRVNCAIEVLSVNNGHGDAYQEAGDVHYLPGTFGSDEDNMDELTACGVRAVGMVRDRKDPSKISCANCVAAWAAFRLRAQPDG